jgi:hypothetical protein
VQTARRLDSYEIKQKPIHYSRERLVGRQTLSCLNQNGPDVIESNHMAAILDEKRKARQNREQPTCLTENREYLIISQFNEMFITRFVPTIVKERATKVHSRIGRFPSILTDDVQQRKQIRI